RHGEGAVGEIDEIHQAERDRQPARKHEQQHAVCYSVEQDRQHPQSLARGRSGSRASGCPDSITTVVAIFLRSVFMDSRLAGLWPAPRNDSERYFCSADFTGSFTAGKLANSTL